jgi:signal transduction histidine kinase
MVEAMRVLVAEDHEMLATAIGTGLRREGMAVDVVLDGDNALEHLAVTQYDVLVLDRDLPGTRGLVVNLVDNALRHNVTDGHVEVRTGMADGRATIWVGNTGTVIPRSEVGGLAQPFAKPGSDRTRHGDGHGLGLAIVYAIARAHNASLAARVRPEGGLDIEVSFP